MLLGVQLLFVATSATASQTRRQGQLNVATARAVLAAKAVVAIATAATAIAATVNASTATTSAFDTIEANAGPTGHNAVCSTIY